MSEVMFSDVAAHVVKLGSNHVSGYFNNPL